MCLLTGHYEVRAVKSSQPNAYKVIIVVGTTVRS